MESLILLSGNNLFVCLFLNVGSLRQGPLHDQRSTTDSSFTENDSEQGKINVDLGLSRWEKDDTVHVHQASVTCQFPLLLLLQIYFYNLL